WAVNCLGHGHPVMVEAIRAQAGRLINCSPAFHNEWMARLTALIAPSSGLDHVFLCNSGAEANERASLMAPSFASAPLLQRKTW
ncbi:aminotransferase class III-fold pyridoxal phosphate-dependent enzyme, partial [Klebsiella pneumoniae]